MSFTDVLGASGAARGAIYHHFPGAGGGCAVAALTVRAGEDGDNDALRQVAATTFSSWTGQLAERLTEAGLAADKAGELAALLLALLEGAHIMYRAAGTIAPFDEAAHALITLTESL